MYSLRIRSTLSRTRCACACEKKTVFETKGRFPYASSLYDIEDLMTSSTGMRYEHKKEYFEGHGLDLESVEKYYNVVKSLNATLYTPEKKFREDNGSIFPWVMKLFFFYLSIVTTSRF